VPSSELATPAPERLGDCNDATDIGMIKSVLGVGLRWGWRKSATSGTRWAGTVVANTRIASATGADDCQRDRLRCERRHCSQSGDVAAFDKETIAKVRGTRGWPVDRAGFEAGAAQRAARLPATGKWPADMHVIPHSASFVYRLSPSRTSSPPTMVDAKMLYRRPMTQARLSVLLLTVLG
jgi:hypothetical protein